MTSSDDASVHLHLRGPLDEQAVAGLRQQLAARLASGISRVEVHVDSQPEIELPVSAAPRAPTSCTCFWTR